jgi:hypothetical protein
MNDFLPAENNDPNRTNRLFSIREKIMKTHLGTMAVALVLFCLSPGVAQTKPNFSGTWKMNPQKSQFGPSGGPGAITIKFDQQEGALSEVLMINDGGGDNTIEAKYTLDGKESDIALGSESARALARWEGESLVIDWKGGGLGFRRKFTLSGDGKTMTIAVHHTRTDGELDETVVMEKQ